MRMLSALALAAILISRPALACDGGVVAMVYQPDGAVFVAEVNGVPVASALEPGEAFTGTSRLPPWLLPGENEVTVATETPSDGGAVEVFMNCPGVMPASAGENDGSFGVIRLDQAGRQSFVFESPAGAAMDLPYSDAVHAGDDGLDAKVKALQTAFLDKDVPAIVAEYGVMMQVAEAMGRPIGADRLSAVLSQTLPDATIDIVEDYEIREAMGGRLRIVTGPDRTTAPIVMRGGRLRLSSARIWSHIDGDWRLVAQ